MLKVIPYEWGIASRVGNDIYINKKILEDKELLAAILVHENLHTETLTWKDMLVDLNGEGLQEVKGKYWGFVLTNPESWLQFLPVWKYPLSGWAIDWFMLIFWLLTGGLIWLLTTIL